jgi:hypothetical protein
MSGQLDVVGALAVWALSAESFWRSATLFGSGVLDGVGAVLL